jgi:hypothetical protein
MYPTSPLEGLSATGNTNVTSVPVWVWWIQERGSRQRGVWKTKYFFTEVSTNAVQTTCPFHEKKRCIATFRVTLLSKSELIYLKHKYVPVWIS